MPQVKICKKCVLPEHKPDIWFNQQGICNVCVAFEKRKASRQSGRLLETELIKILNKYRGRGKYHCLVMCSGGKDSTSALYYMKKRYRLNPLAFTFEHGFENEEAVENVKNAVEKLKVDFLFFKSDFIQDLFSELIKTKSEAPVCLLCSMWYMQLTYDLATRYNIPLIIAGWTRGQFTRQEVSSGIGSRLPQEPEFGSMTEATSDFVEMIRKKYPKYKNFPKTMNEINKRYKRILVISPHWFLQNDPQEYSELIKRELGWRPIQVSYPTGSTNCYLNYLGAHLSMKYYGFTHYHIEMSKLIRAGELNREEALRALEINISKEPIASILTSVLKKLGCQLTDL